MFDRCKELFGLNCIGMELRVGKFRIVKKDKSVLSYKDNWRVEETGGGGGLCCDGKNWEL